MTLNTITRELSDNLSAIRSDEIVKILNNNSFEAKSNISIDAGFKNLNDLQINKFQNIINNSDIDVITKYNKDNQYMEQNITYSYNGSKGMEVTTYSDNNNTYLYLNNVFDKYISIDSTKTKNMIFNSTELSENDYKYLIKKIKGEFNKISLKPYITTAKNQELIIGEEKVKTKKISLSITKMLQESAFDNMIKNLKGDDKFIDILIKAINNKEYDTRDKVKESIDKYFETLKKANNGNDILSLYTKGIFNKPVMFELSNEKGDLIQVTNYKTKTEDFKILIKENVIDLLNLTSKEVSKNNYDINIAIKDEQFNSFNCNINGTILENEMNLKYDLKANLGNLIQKNEFNITGDLKTKATYNSVDKSANQIFEFSLNSESIGNFALKVNNEIKVSVETIQMPFIYYTIDASELTDSEYEKILYNIIKKYPAIGEIVNYLSISMM